jgi:hypothetical protein
MENTTAKHLVELSDAYGDHVGISHWRVAFLVRGNGQFFKHLKDGRGCTLKTAAAVLQWFSDNWPEDLAWPKDIARPAKTKRAA